MKVLHVIESMGHGGAEWLIVEHVRNAGVDVEPLVCAINGGGPALEAVGRLGARTFVLGKGERRAQAIAELSRILRDEGIDVVNGHNPVGGLYGALAGWRAKVPVVVRTEHSVHYSGRHSWIYPLLELGSTVLTRRVVCVCQAVLESHVRRMPWAARRFVTVANGISSAPRTRPREMVRRELGLAPGERAALTVGSLTPAKAQHLLIDAFALAAGRLRDARLLVAGDGPLRARLEERAHGRGVADRVRFLGARSDTAELMEACDLFALSSVREGLPVTVLEAMRAGRPVVATAAGGTREAVLDGVTGRVVAMRDVRRLAEALVEVLGDGERAAALGCAGRRRFLEEFTAERMVRETERLYREQLGVRPGALSVPGAESRRATS